MVRALVAGRQADFFLDRKTHLPVKIVFPAEGGAGPYVRLRDYVEVGGVSMPSKVGHEGDARTPYAYVLNPAYDARVFERPPTVEAGPEAWMWRGAR